MPTASIYKKSPSRSLVNIYKYSLPHLQYISSPPTRTTIQLMHLSQTALPHFLVSHRNSSSTNQLMHLLLRTVHFRKSRSWGLLCHTTTTIISINSINNPSLPPTQPPPNRTQNNQQPNNTTNNTSRNRPCIPRRRRRGRGSG